MRVKQVYFTEREFRKIQFFQKLMELVDEAQAILGLVRTECGDNKDLEDKIIHIERDLYV